MVPTMKLRLRYVVPAAAAVILTTVAGIAMVRGVEAGAALEVTEAWARATPPGAKTGAAYISLRNNGAEDDALLAATSTAAGSVEIHETVEKDGVAKMRPLGEAPIPAGGMLEMKPGGTHLMLMELSAPLVEGSMVPLTLTFKQAGAITIHAEIGPLGADAPHGHGH